MPARRGQSPLTETYKLNPPLKEEVPIETIKGQAQAWCLLVTELIVDHGLSPFEPGGIALEQVQGFLRHKFESLDKAIGYIERLVFAGIPREQIEQAKRDILAQPEKGTNNEQQQENAQVGPPGAAAH